MRVDTVETKFTALKETTGRAKVRGYFYATSDVYLET